MAAKPGTPSIAVSEDLVLLLRHHSAGCAAGALILPARECPQAWLLTSLLSPKNSAPFLMGVDTMPTFRNPVEGHNSHCKRCADRYHQPSYSAIRYAVHVQCIQSLPTSACALNPD
ncbi:hypothetical protein BAUCODRAFT_28871 [Baudoinia panamericana UAMH 10762]|uniref:Uncharacterized protein n=1 Tax=Baudoinia panamericana (strain UAMH 10762) TaxID=717646 RepID=M2M0K7_BAUPA|nr:uncharacterized protein BAUCODRAFT_28871 [Baudoinia panamericana UAMH 10762]EMD00523.1 hypothetical protein BAUCODRAFT_28871 [Baudoinia panamericana UAMH 10762]